MKSKYIWLSLIVLGFTACQNDDNTIIIEPAVELTAGSANFSKFVSVGNSLTAGFTDNALFIAGQQNSFPNILSQQFALVGGGTFVQPLMNDNFGGMSLGGMRILDPRLVTTGGSPLPLESVIGPITPTTDLLVNNPTGPFNNMGVPGARGFHLLAPGYGNLGNFPAAANPYFIRMTGSNPNATVLDLTLAQAPTFFSLWIGNNDVLGYATSGGDGSSDITDLPTFTGAYNALVGALSAGAQGVLANIPDITSIPHFTTVPYDSVPLDEATADQLNSGFALYNGGIAQAFAFLVSINQITQTDADAEIAKRTVVYSAGLNPMLIMDETLTDLTGINPALLSMRPATADDLFVLPSLSFIGTTVGGNPSLINGVSVPLADNWVLLPSEQLEIKEATGEFNGVIESAAQSAGLAFVDANALMNQLATTGIASGNFILTSDLVLGGAFSLDGVHPTSRGYALIANEFLKAIDATYGSTFYDSGNILNVGNYPTNFSPLLQ